MQPSKNNNTFWVFIFFLLLSIPVVAQTNVSAKQDKSLAIDSISCDTIVSAYEITMALEPSNSLSQGGACFDDYYIVGVNNNARFNLYNLKKKSFICTIPVSAPAPSKKIHANTINFSHKFYKSSDILPLLYVCSGFGDSIANQSHIYVYRLTQSDASNYESHLVQDITLDFPGWTECVVDNEHEVLWVKKYIKKNQIEFLKYPIPSIENTKVKLTPDEAEERIPTYEIPIQTQGFIYHNDHIYSVIGVPSPKVTCYLVDFNLKTRDYDRFTSLYDLGLMNPEKKRDDKWEPENIFVYNGDFYIGYRSFICRLNWEKVVEEHNYRLLFDRVYN